MLLTQLVIHPCLSLSTFVTGLWTSSCLQLCISACYCLMCMPYAQSLLPADLLDMAKCDWSGAFAQAWCKCHIFDAAYFSCRMVKVLSRRCDGSQALHTLVSRSTRIHAATALHRNAAALTTDAVPPLATYAVFQTCMYTFSCSDDCNLRQVFCTQLI